MLKDIAIKGAKPRDKPYKLADGGGLYLLVTPKGGHWWRLKYRFRGREKLLSLGVYPEVSLKAARERRDEARRQIAAGADPSAERQAAKLALADNLEAVANEWLELQEKKLAPVTVAKARWMLQFVLPTLGSRPVGQIAAPDLLKALRQIETRGTNETAHRTKQLCGQIFRYAIATGRAQRDPSADLRGALAPIVSGHHAAVTEPARIGELLRAIDGFEGQPVTKFALKLAPLLFVRPGELRQAEWTEFDLDGAEWRIPAERMKMRERHIVPLSTQAIALLRELHLLTGTHRYVFPSVRTWQRPMSENTVNAGLRRLGYSTEEMTGHGFRSLASTSLNELGWNPNLIELQLAHKDRDKVRAAYNRAEHLPERRKMMQAWANYLDGLRASGNVVAFKRKDV